MKNITFILLFSFSASIAQNNNKLIIEFIDSHYGEKVGSGICEDLIFKAWDYVNNSNGYIDSVLDQVDVSEIMPGDIIEFDSTLLSSGLYIENHMAIVYSISLNGTISIAEQNAGDGQITPINYRGRKAPLMENSRVQISTINISSIASGKIYFTRI